MLTQEIIDNLNSKQNASKYHPYTCLYDGDKKHIRYEFKKLGLNISYNKYIKQQLNKSIPYPHMEFKQTNLIAILKGWKSPCCGYNQKIII